MPRGFFDYAIKDAIVTIRVNQELLRRIAELLDAHGVDREPIKQWGLLTQRIQVQAAIALAAVERNGMAIDRDRLTELREGLKCRQVELVESLGQETPGLFKSDKRGELVINRKTGTPSKSHAVLAHELLRRLP